MSKHGAGLESVYCSFGSFNCFDYSLVFATFLQNLNFSLGIISKII